MSDAPAHWQELAIFQQADWIFVAPVDAPEEWIARFEVRAGFPALEWAQRLTTLYNADPYRRANHSQSMEPFQPNGSRQ